MIFHLTSESAWAEAQQTGQYTAASLTAEGFIHCSTAAQLVEVANSFYRDLPDPAVLCVDPGLLDVPVKWEAPVHPHPTDDPTLAQTFRWFPHIYGAIPVDAVAQVVPLPRTAEGIYTLPEALRWLPRRVALLVFDDVEVLDFAGPFEVFSRALSPAGDPLFDVTVFSPDGQPLAARGGLRLLPDGGYTDLRQPDILIIPGGSDAGVEPIMADAAFIAWLRDQADHVELLLSVCTGAWILATAGLLRDLRATTYHTDYARLRAIEPTVTPCVGERWADNGRIVTSAGVSAGIDMSLYTVQKLFGADSANATARRMEYEYFHAE